MEFLHLLSFLFLTLPLLVTAVPIPSSGEDQGSKPLAALQVGALSTDTTQLVDAGPDLLTAGLSQASAGVSALTNNLSALSAVSAVSHVKRDKRSPAQDPSLTTDLASRAIDAGYELTRRSLEPSASTQDSKRRGVASALSDLDTEAAPIWNVADHAIEEDVLGSNPLTSAADFQKRASGSPIPILIDNSSN